jgi:hypothetical protein
MLRVQFVAQTIGSSSFGDRFATAKAEGSIPVGENLPLATVL